MFKLRRFLRGYKVQLIVGPLCKLFEAVLELFVPLVMASIIDNGILKNDSSYVLWMGGALVLLGIVGLSSALVCQYMASYTSQGAGTQIRSALFRHIGTLSHKELDELTTPALITRMTSDINFVQANIAMTMRLLLRAPFLIIGALMMSFFIDAQIAVIFLGATAAIGIILFFVMRGSLPFYKKIQSGLDRISLLSRENLEGNRVIRAFSKQKAQTDNLEKEADGLSKLTIRVSRLSSLLNPATYVITYIAVILILWFGSGKVDSGVLLSGDIVALTSYMTQILLAMIVLANLVVLLSKGEAGASRINAVFAVEPSVREINKTPVNVAEDAPAVEFRNVSFSYGGGDDELQDISFTIDKNSTTGIIGATGSGKSTLLSLITRYYDVTSGEVKVDGVNVKEYPFNQLRGKIAEVPQKSVLFSGTIRENLRWQKPNATDDEIWKALRIAQADSFVESLDKYVSRGGRNFSGGQRQRLCIARALVGNPGLVILDDSFSALDFATEKKLRNELKNIDAAKIIVTQRCSTIMDADKILVLEDGRLTGEGTHGQLYENNETYREICLTQLKGAQ